MGKFYIGIKDSESVKVAPKATPATIVQTEFVEKIIEVPVEVVREVEKLVQVPVEVIREVEKIVEVPVEVIREIEKPVIVEKIVEMPVEKIIHVADFSIQHALNSEIRRLKSKNRLALMALVVLILLNMLPR